MQRLAVRDDHLVLMLPGIGSEKAMQFVTRLRALARQRLGLDLDIGVSSFPGQEVTLGGLLDHAESEMRAHTEKDDVSDCEVLR